MYLSFHIYELKTQINNQMTVNIDLREKNQFIKIIHTFSFKHVEKFLVFQRHSILNSFTVKIILNLRKIKTK